MRRFLAIAAVALCIGIMSCSPPTPAAVEPPPTPAAAPASPADILLSVMTPVVSAEIGKPVSLQPTTTNVDGDWAYLVALPRNADGSAIDWATTSLASAHEHGAMDVSGAVHALLHKESGVWVVLEHVVGATDVAWADWSTKHNVPAGVIPAA